MQRGWGQEPQLRPALPDFLQAVAPGMALRRDSALDPRQRLLSERKRTLSTMKEAPGAGDTAPLLHEPAVCALDEAVQQPIAALDGFKNKPGLSRMRVVEVSRKGDAHPKTTEPRRKRQAEGAKTEDVEAQRSAPKSKRLMVGMGTLRRWATEVGPNLGRVQVVEAEKARRRHEETAAATRQEMVPNGEHARSMENMGTPDIALLLREPAAEDTQPPAAALDDSRLRLDASDLTSVPKAEAHHHREDGSRRELPETVVLRASIAHHDTDLARALELEHCRRKQAEAEKAMLQRMKRDRKMRCTVQ
jgi:hypothetical protein